MCSYNVCVCVCGSMRECVGIYITRVYLYVYKYCSCFFRGRKGGGFRHDNVGQMNMHDINSWVEFKWHWNQHLNGMLLPSTDFVDHCLSHLIVTSIFFSLSLSFSLSLVSFRFFFFLIYLFVCLFALFVCLFGWFWGQLLAPLHFLPVKVLFCFRFVCHDHRQSIREIEIRFLIETNKWNINEINIKMNVTDAKRDRARNSCCGIIISIGTDLSSCCSISTATNGARRPSTRWRRAASSTSASRRGSCREAPTPITLSTTSPWWPTAMTFSIKSSTASTGRFIIHIRVMKYYARCLYMNVCLDGNGWASGNQLAFSLIGISIILWRFFLVFSGAFWRHSWSFPAMLLLVGWIGIRILLIFWLLFSVGIPTTFLADFGIPGRCVFQDAFRLPRHPADPSRFGSSS